MKGPCIAVIEDEKELVKLLTYNLEKNGYTVVTALDGEDGLKMVRTKKPALIILDIMLPKIDGFELCRLIRQDSKVPIIMLTAKQEELDRVLGLELGADDYVTKPFSVREVLARVKAILRRSGEKLDDASLIRVGELEVDKAAYEVRNKGKILNMSTKEFDLLNCLLSAKGRALTREKILESVWGVEEGLELDTRTVDQHVARLRDKLGSAGEFLVTVKNVGYRFRLK